MGSYDPKEIKRQRAQHLARIKAGGKKKRHAGNLVREQLLHEYVHLLD